MLGGLVKLGLGGAQLAHALSLQFEAVCAVHEPVQHGVGDGGIADVLMPVLHGHLAGDDGGGPVMPVIDASNRGKR